MTNAPPFSRDEAAALDTADGLGFARARFALPGGVLYLDGNSLGAMPRRTGQRVADVIAREWGIGLIRSWNDAGWIDAPARIGARIARLVGAAADEVTVADSTSINVFKLAAAAVGLNAPRNVILTEAGNFPTDVYMLHGLAALTGGTVEIRSVARDAIAGALDDSVAALLLTQVDYKTGAVHDMVALTAAAHAAGALAIWDLSHSTGAIAVDLNAAGADLAVGCGYKYLNGGPGAPSYIFAAARHHGAMRQPLQGWMGHAAPFAFAGDYAPGAGMARMLCGTPGIIGMAALEAGIATFDGIDLGVAEAKSRALGDLMLGLVAARCPELVPACPTGDARRGAQISLAHPHAYAICRALIDAGVIGDFREPDVLRFGFPALYTRFVDVWDAVDRLAAIMASGRWQEARFAERLAVT